MNRLFYSFGLSIALAGLCACSDSSSSGAGEDGTIFSSSSVSGPGSSSAPDVSSSSAFKADSADWREGCLEIINAYRATEGIFPLSLADDARETCVDAQAAKDLASGVAHGNFGSCDEWAQNSAPDVNVAYYGSPLKIAEAYLKMMWEDEKEKALAGDTVYADIGHYLNMKNAAYDSVACGVAFSADSSTAWMNIDFY